MTPAEAPIIPHDVGPGVRADAPSGESALALARRELVRRHEAALAAADSWAVGDKARSFALGIASGIDLAVLLLDAVRADRGTGAVSAETIFALAQHHPVVDLARELASIKARAAAPVSVSSGEASEEEMALVPRRALERLQAALDDAFSVIAKRPEAPRSHAFTGPVSPDVTGRPRVPGPAL